ncbi:hypothetical protein [Comamonas sp.]|uniref:hypothetical protein n=1 Tax=Comamonas sp. TaxID=34028 RepID=UPI0012C8B1D3|nr:hypothetical protein [Comamonas sp.]MPS96252.1 hypothetical protein [Comamonas sp.]
MKSPLYRLSDAWLAYCHALTVPVADVQELAALGSVLEAFRHLSKHLAGKGTGAIGAQRPLTPPFVAVAQVGASVPAAEQSPATQAGVVALPSPSAASGVPTADFEAAAVAFALRALPVSQAGKSRRFRPLVRSRLLLVPSVYASRISMRIFVLNKLLGGASNGRT